jgi:hypothetical protein
LSVPPLLAPVPPVLVLPPAGEPASGRDIEPAAPPMDAGVPPLEPLPAPASPPAALPSLEHAPANVASKASTPAELVQRVTKPTYREPLAEDILRKGSCVRKRAALSAFDCELRLLAGFAFLPAH